MNNIFHYCGHIISNNESGRFPASSEKLVQSTIEGYLADIKIDSCYGSLASGADIMLAEAMVSKGAKLHVVLPFDKIDFINASVKSSGSKWIKRFNVLLNKAESMTQVYYKTPKDEILSYSQCTIVAMGLSLQEAIKKDYDLEQQLKQITIWDNEKTNGIAGTYPDMLRWRALGLASTYISSKKPIELSLFKKVNEIKTKALTVKIYNKNNMNNFIVIKSLDDLTKILKSNPYNGHYIIDFDHSVFGKFDSINTEKISMRALGLIIFYFKMNSGNATNKRQGRLLFKKEFFGYTVPS